MKSEDVCVNARSELTGVKLSLRMHVAAKYEQPHRRQANHL